MAEALRSKGIAQIIQGQLQEALGDLNDAMDIYHNLNMDMDVAKVLVDLGMGKSKIRSIRRNTKSILKCFEKASKNW